MRKLILPSLLFVLITGLPQVARADATDFEHANQLYEEGRYLEAIEAYETLLTHSPTLAVHFNLGNAWFKSGQLGEAIAQYRQAEALAPRDPDVRANLKFARARVDGPSYQPGWLRQRAQTLTLGEWTLLTTLAIWGWFGLLIAGQLRPPWKAALRPWALGTGALTVLLLGITLWLHRSIAATQIVVLVQRDTVMRLGPFEESKSALNLKDGSELRVLDRKDGWLQVTPDGRQSGWIPSETARLAP